MLACFALLDIKVFSVCIMQKHHLYYCCILPFLWGVLCAKENEVCVRTLYLIKGGAGCVGIFSGRFFVKGCRASWICCSRYSTCVSTAQCGNFFLHVSCGQQCCLQRGCYYKAVFSLTSWTVSVILRIYMLHGEATWRTKNISN